MTSATARSHPWAKILRNGVFVAATLVTPGSPQTYQHSQNLEGVKLRQATELSDREKYDKLLQEFRAHGLEIDEKHSTFHPGSKLVIYLPDIHQNTSQALNRGQLKTMLELSRASSVGLEGLAGRIANEPPKEEDTIHPTVADKKVRLTKLVLSMDFLKPTPKADEEIVDSVTDVIDSSVKFLSKPNGVHIHDTSGNSVFVPEGAPGLAYLGGIPKDVGIFGLEDGPTYLNAVAALDKRVVFDIFKDDAGLYRSYLDDVESKYDHLPPEEKTKEDEEVLSRVKDAKRLLAGFHDTCSSELAELKKCTDDSTDVILEKRTAQWSENISKYAGRTIVVVGGAQHTDLLYGHLNGRGMSTITLSDWKVKEEERKQLLKDLQDFLGPATRK